MPAQGWSLYKGPKVANSIDFVNAGYVAYETGQYNYVYYCYLYSVGMADTQ